MFHNLDLAKRDRQDELANIKKEMIKSQIIGAPGMILLFLGMYSLLCSKGDPIHPFFNSVENCYTVLAVGIVGAV